MLGVLLLVALAYLLGSIPTGYLVVKKLKGIDLRKQGSGSTGATNVLRTAGSGAAIFVLIVDVLKGYLPVVGAAYYESTAMIGPIAWLHLTAPLVALAALVGHSKSIFFDFQGGKSAATALGTLIALNPWVGILVFAIWSTLVWVTRIVSISSMITGVLSGLLMYVFNNPASYVAYCGMGAVYIIVRHKTNIERILKGTEPRIGEKITKST